MVTIAFKLADIKLEVLNICRYLERFFTYKKIHDIVLKFRHHLLRMQKIVEIG